MSIPQVKDYNGLPTLFVKDEPFFCLAGELHNSDTSDPAYMEREVWPRLQGLNMNSVIAPIYWECIEKTEGVYDFSSLDVLIRQAREAKLHLILLWFGLWKNAESMYVPGWMKRNTKTYFRVKNVKGEPINTISPLCSAAIEKDASCFRAVMRRIRETDEEENTVIVMQVENEIGVLGSSRDYSEAANKAYAEAVPAALAGKLGVSGSWKEAFGGEADESFMAYQFASAVETIASAGREEYPLPCYANAWLRQYPWHPGSYPMGGPVPGMHRIWKAAAPSLFALGPDIYVPYVADVMDEYAYSGNPLFIPEVRKDAVASSYCLYAFWAKNAVCFSPFGIEEISLDPSEVDQPPMEVMIALNIDPSAFDIRGSKDYLARTYSFIEESKSLLLAYRGTEHMKAFCRHGEYDYGCYLRFRDYDILASYAPRESAKPLGAGVIIEESPDCFLIFGMMCSLSFRAKPDENLRVEMISLEEGDIHDGVFKRGRILNGDEKMSLQFGDMPSELMLEMYQY